MPLPLPNLDDRRWNDLVEEGRALIPRYAPGWTDHNIHDPGITLLELFAWLAEGDIFRLNQISERHRRKFLALTGIQPRPPQPASTLLAVTSESDAAPFTLPQGVLFAADLPDGDEVQFSLEREVTIVASNLVAVQVDSGPGPRDWSHRWGHRLPIFPFGPDANEGAALYLGFDTPLPAGVKINLGISVLDQGVAVDNRERIMAEFLAHLRDCRPLRPNTRCAPDDLESPGDSSPTLPPHHGVRLIWECWSAGRWLAATKVIDNTRAFTLTGTVQLELPTATTAVARGDVAESLHYLRCRLDRGSRYDASPQLSDLFLNAAPAIQMAPAWQRWTLSTPATIEGPLPVPGHTTRLAFALDERGDISQLNFNPDAPDWPELTVYALEETGTPEPYMEIPLIFAGWGSGRAGQQLTLPEAQIVAATLRLFSLEHIDSNFAWHIWEAQADLDASGPADRHYVVDPTTAVVTFGDGNRGMVPPAGIMLLANYEHTFAEKGNIPAGKILNPASVPQNDILLAGITVELIEKVENRVSANGGQAAESLFKAIGRAVEILWAHERLQELCARFDCQTLDGLPPSLVLNQPAPSKAVTALDLERLALDVPGTRIARARAWTNTHPAYPCYKAPGHVTVVIIPSLPQERPQPGAGLKKVIQRYLNRRRLVTTHVHVVGPDYVTVRVQAQVRRIDGVDAKRLAQDIEAALDRFLDPLAGGEEGRGWPFGRDVYRTEILQVIDNVPGVEYVAELNLLDEKDEQVCGNSCVGPFSLVTPGEHLITVLQE